MKDNVFGEMDFQVGWYEMENINLWGNIYTFKIRTSTLKEERPNELQQQSYISFKKNLKNISEQSLPLMNEFLSANMEDILEYFGQPLPNALTDLLIPNQVLFFKNGKVAIIFDVAWTEDNVVILLEDKIKVDYGYIIENEI